MKSSSHAAALLLAVLAGVIVQADQSLLPDTVFNGTSHSDLFGQTVSLSGDGQTLAVGATGVNSYKGQVNVYQLQGAEWVPMGDPLNGTTDDGQFSSRVSLSGDGQTLAVGSHGSDAFQGQVHTYKLQGAEWVPMGAPLNGTSPDDSFGQTVSLSDDGQTLAVGATGVNSYKGQVSVYQLQGAEWVPMGAPLDGTSPSDTFGHTISLSDDGQTLAVGENSGNGRTSVYKYQLGVWDMVGNPLDGTSHDDSFGGAISLSGDGQTLAVGALGWNSYKGQASVYELQGDVLSGETVDWVLIGNPLDGTSDNAYFGCAISLSDDGQTLAVGAHGSDASSGQTSVYERQGVEWVLIGNPLDGTVDDGQFGVSVSLSGDGQALAVGAQGVYSGTGQVYIYEISDGAVVSTTAATAQPTTTASDTNPTLISMDDVVAAFDQWDYTTRILFLTRIKAGSPCAQPEIAPASFASIRRWCVQRGFQRRRRRRPLAAV